ANAILPTNAHINAVVAVSKKSNPAAAYNFPPAPLSLHELVRPELVRRELVHTDSVLCFSSTLHTRQHRRRELIRTRIISSAWRNIRRPQAANQRLLNRSLNRLRLRFQSQAVAQQ